MDLTPVFIIAIVFASIYKIIELFVRRHERMALINNLTSDNIKRIENGNISLSITTNQKFTALKFGTFALGLGIGLLAYVFININYSEIENSYFLKSTLCSSLCLIGGGIGLLIAFIIENSMQKTESK